ncbi:MAG: ATP synthase F1 subunit epsilon [Clostridia bacterium]|nr:ATP synthase F1 subunit epsilon [Clostridia bacterium]
MKTFELKIITPDGMMYDAEAESILVRTTLGDVTILPSHADYLALIEYGHVKIKSDGKERFAAATNGFLSVSGGKVRVVATTFEFADEIDKDRAERAKREAEERRDRAKSDAELRVAEMKLKRALLRLDVSNRM